VKDVVGTFYTSARIENIGRTSGADVSKLLVDTGAEFTWISATFLDRIGVQREKKDYRFVTATGQAITRPVGFGIIRIDEAFTVDEIVFAEPADRQLLGARSLEGLNLRVDSREKKLVAGGPILAA
jgi:predicted aspartyl protease